MPRLLDFVGLVLILGLVVAAKESKIKNGSVFVPSNEWKIVEKGQPLPPGLHVRHNFQTGVTEAKFLEKDEEKNTNVSLDPSQASSLILHPQKSVKDDDESQTENKSNEKPELSIDNLKTVLKKIKSDESQGNDALSSKKIERKQRAREEVSKIYSNLMDGKESFKTVTDSEVLKMLLERFEAFASLISSDNLSASDLDDVVNILSNLEYLAHQFDNARNFADMNGISRIISPCLNSSYYELHTGGLKLLGVAVQNNPKVQLKALESDLLQKLLYIVVNHNNLRTILRCMFSLGALLRDFPAAQRTLISNGGLQMLGKILIDGHFLVQTRVINIIGDMATERNNLEKIEDEKERFLRIKEYAATNFEKEILNQKYCENLINLMIRSSDINYGQFDFYAVIYNSMNILSSACKDEYKNRIEDLLEGINKLLHAYSLPKKNRNDKSFHYHPELLRELLRFLKTLQHDEL